MNRKPDQNLQKTGYFRPAPAVRLSLALSLAVLLVAPVIAQATKGSGGSLRDQLQRGLDANKAGTKPPAPADAVGAAQAGLAGLGNSAAGAMSLLNPAALAPLFATPTAEEKLESSGPVLKRAAEQVFLAGDLQTALNLMFGHMAAEYEDAKPTIQSVMYSKLLRRPVWNVRFAASMSVRDSGADGADPSPIQGDSTSAARRTNVSSGTRQTGRGNSLEDQLRARLGSGRNRPSQPKPDRGKPAAADSASPAEQLSKLAGGPPDQTETAPSAAETIEMSDSEPGEELAEYLGLVADVFADLFLTRFQDGRFGPLLTNVSAQPTDLAADQTGNADAAESWSSPSALPMWIPGVVYLGIGTSKDMVQQASDSDVDILVHFEVIIKEDRNKNVQNLSRCRLIDVSSGKSIGLSKPIDSAAERQLPADSGGRTYIEKQLGNLFDILDRDVAVTSLPTLTAEVARRRVGTLMGTAPPRSLRTLAEIRLYQSQQLLTQEEVETAFDIVGGTESLTFLYGLANERTAMAHAWATNQN